MTAGEPATLEFRIGGVLARGLGILFRNFVPFGLILEVPLWRSY